ncbi:hypothetical protein SAMN04489761_3453 [Tenacibaculum sp. MAR_2009_124]|uniref:hypothetical protein n=1 Tax=Tenacibaculum sp. MAR_2009_124 TaxID=1250059 RepID=UPI0008979E55|nr:hypothetical protein [Tenacibaculum sp. MAR_2009_124]SEC66911.1 hypothetical protein SAMN04489761_3453 [Tenacibaculum sp. MAR_2009_124]
MSIENQVYSYRILKNGIISSGEDYFSKLEIPNKILEILELGANELVIEFENEKYEIWKTDSLIPGIPVFDLN